MGGKACGLGRDKWHCCLIFWRNFNDQCFFNDQYYMRLNLGQSCGECTGERFCKTFWKRFLQDLLITSQAVICIRSRQSHVVPTVHCVHSDSCRDPKLVPAHILCRWVQTCLLWRLECLQSSASCQHIDKRQTHFSTWVKGNLYIGEVGEVSKVF